MTEEQLTHELMDKMNKETEHKEDLQSRMVESNEKLQRLTQELVELWTRAKNGNIDRNI